MKRTCAFILTCAMILLGLCGCSNSKENADNNTTFLESPSPFSEASDEPAPFDSSSYIGTWSTEGINWVDGGSMLKVSVSGDKMTLAYSEQAEVQEAHTAEASGRVSLNSVQGNTVTFDFGDDGWGNPGTLKVTFGENKITCEVKDVERLNENWGITEGKYVMERNDYAEDALYYTMAQYFELFPENAPDGYWESFNNTSDGNADNWVESEPVNDTSKASGILAASGLTEDGFRSICTYIGSDMSDDLGAEYAIARGKQYYDENPVDKADEVHYATKRWENYQTTGVCSTSQEDNLKNANSLEEYLELELKKPYKSKGSRIIKEESKELLRSMLDYPGDYIGTPLLLGNLAPDYLDGGGVYYIYEFVLPDIPCEITDLRDDIHSPNVLAGSKYNMYVTFQGTYTTNAGGIGLMFSLLSLEKAS